MADARDVPSILSAAERAAADGDYAAAEAHLRAAAARQEADLGPLSPELADTLNNLAVVCERTAKPADAERCYRRAHAIAVASLDADHPFVKTSWKNLSEFCAARGLPVDVDTTPPVAARPGGAARTGSPPAGRPSLAAAAIVLGAVGAVALAAFLATRGWRADPPLPGTAASATAPAPPPPAPPPRAAPASRADVSTSAGRRAAPGASSGLVVTGARLCRTLSADWQCHDVTSPVSPGPITFYTRVRSARDATLQHRWYRDDVLHQTVDLDIRANLGPGYRTFSRTTLDAGSGGQWRVELRAPDGTILREERFVVR